MVVEHFQAGRVMERRSGRVAPFGSISFGLGSGGAAVGVGGGTATMQGEALGGCL